MPDITAKLKKVIWRSLENDFTIAAFEPESPGPEFIATGDLFKPAAGIIYSLSGKWENHQKYGSQFKVDSYCVQEPCDTESISIYIEKHVKGIGPVLADKLIEKYGKHTLRILKSAPERVRNENKGLSYKLALKISEQLQEGDKRQDILIQLEGLFVKVKGLPKKLAQNVIEIYGLTAYEVIKNNPYVLIDMTRIGFISADKVALACGVKVDDPKRIRQGILYVIRQSMQESGDVWLQPSMVGNNLLKLIADVKPAIVIDAIIKLVQDKVLAEHNGYVTLTQMAEDESLIVDCVGRFLG